jgi:predicted transcriptional regulator
MSLHAPPKNSLVSTTPHHFFIMKNQDGLSKVALSRALGVSRTTVSSYLSRADAPEADSSGCYDLSAVRSYVAENAGDDLADRLAFEERQQVWKAACVYLALLAQRQLVIAALPRIAKGLGIAGHAAALAAALGREFDRRPTHFTLEQ